MPWKAVDAPAPVVYKDMIYSSTQMRSLTDADRQVIWKFEDIVSLIENHTEMSNFCSGVDYRRHIDSSLILDIMGTKIKDHALKDTIAPGSEVFYCTGSAVAVGEPGWKKTDIAFTAGHNMDPYMNAVQFGNSRGYEPSAVEIKEKTFAIIKEVTSAKGPVKLLYRDPIYDFAMIRLPKPKEIFMYCTPFEKYKGNMKSITSIHFVGFRGESKTTDMLGNTISEDELLEWYGRRYAPSVVGTSMKFLKQTLEKVAPMADKRNYTNFINNPDNVVWQSVTDKAYDEYAMRFHAPGLGGQSGGGGSLNGESGSVSSLYTGWNANLNCSTGVFFKPEWLEMLKQEGEYKA